MWPAYTSLKALHVTCVVLTYSLFVTRGILMLVDSTALQARWARVAPHVIDTVLLGAAIGMLVIAQLNPLHAPWLIAKIVGLLLYIGIGTVALKRGRTRGLRIAAWLLAQLVLFYIVAVAFAKSPWPF
jgi:uncharacterized membrane protein SirB2